MRIRSVSLHHNSHIHGEILVHANELIFFCRPEFHLWEKQPSSQCQYFVLASVRSSRRQAKDTEQDYVVGARDNDPQYILRDVH